MEGMNDVNNNNNSCLLIICPGCQYVLLRCKFIYHCENECTSKEMSCIYKSAGCEQIINRYLMSNHLLQSCHYRIKDICLCELDKSIENEDISGPCCREHCDNCFKKDCSYESCAIVSCSNNCGAKMHLCKLEDHLQLICSASIVNCINLSYGCDARMARCKRGVHLRICVASVISCNRQWSRGVQSCKLYQASLDSHRDSEKWCRQLHGELQKRANRICNDNLMAALSLRDQLYLCSCLNNLSRNTLSPFLMANNTRNISASNLTRYPKKEKISTLQQTLMIVSQYIKYPLTPWCSSNNAQYLPFQFDSLDGCLDNDETFSIDDVSLSLEEQRDWRVQHLTGDQDKPLGTYTFQCGQPVPRCEWEGHWRQHCDISSEMDGWIEIKCPLAYLGCQFSVKRFSGLSSELVYHPLLDTYCQRYFPSLSDFAPFQSSLLLQLPFELLTRVFSFLDGCSLFHVSRTHRRLQQAVQLLLGKRCVSLDWDRCSNGSWNSHVVRFLPISLGSLQVVNGKMHIDNSLGTVSKHLPTCCFNQSLTCGPDIAPYCMFDNSNKNNNINLPSLLHNNT